MCLSCLAGLVPLLRYIWILPIASFTAHVDDALGIGCLQTKLGEFIKIRVSDVDDRPISGLLQRALVELKVKALKHTAEWVKLWNLFLFFCHLRGYLLLLVADRQR